VVGPADIVADRLGRVVAEKDRAGIAYPGIDRLGLGKRQFDMLGGDCVGKIDRIVQRLDENDSAMISPAFAGHLRRAQHGQLLVHLPEHFICKLGTGRHQYGLRAHAVLGLGQQVGRNPVGPGRFVGNHQHLGRPGNHVNADSPEHLALGFGHIGIARPDDLGDRGDGAGAEG
jgi:hypothetical protein